VRVAVRLVVTVIVALGLNAGLSAQLAQSSGYQLLDLGLDGGGGGTCSVSYAAQISISPWTGGEMSSTGFKVGVGFLEGTDPMPSNLPVVFGVDPPFGDKDTPTLVTVSGLNFTKSGVGPTLGFTVDGVPATSVVPVSNTTAVALFPAGNAGPQDVGVSTSVGATLRADAYIYTPAVIVTPVVSLGGLVTVTNYGDTSNTFTTFVSPQQTNAGTKFGQLLIGPDILIGILSLVDYPAPDGIFTINFPMPVLPVLSGVTLYFQSMTVFTASPLDGELTNAQSMFIN